MWWWRKFLNTSECNNEIYNIPEIKPIEKPETLEEWREKAINYRLEKRGSVFTETPYDTYIIKYCFNCIDFNPKSCFNINYTMRTGEINNCAKLRLINKKLDKVNK